MDESDPARLQEIELEENLRRLNLTPMEEAEAVARLHRMRQEQNPEQTAKETAELVSKIEGRNETTISDQVRVANSLIVDQFAEDPEVQEAAKHSLSRAAKVAKKKMELDLVRALQGESTLQTPSSLNTVHRGNCLEVIPTLPANTFDVMLFDPPYGIGADNFGDAAADITHQYQDDWQTAVDLVSGILARGDMILKQKCSILMFCAYEKFSEWQKIYASFGWQRLASALDLE